MEKSQVAIIIPAFNEEDTIANVVVATQKYGIVIVVNDASTDNTKKIALKAGAILVDHQENLGYDEALNSGFKKASELQSDIAITFDADGQHDEQLLQDYISLIEQGFDVVIGVRNKFQRFAERVFSWVSKRKWNISDPLCGMKAYRMSVYKQLGHFDSYNSIGTELTIYTASHRGKIAQIEIRTKERKGKPRFGSGLRSNITIFRALWTSCRKYL